MPQASLLHTHIFKVQQNERAAHLDLLTVEEPLEIRLGFGPTENRQQKSLSVTMRTPGQDFELALGFLFTENIIQTYEDVHSIRYCQDLGKQTVADNIVRVELKENVELDLNKLQRHFYTTSSCGVCGKASIEAVEMVCPTPLSNSTPSFNTTLIHQLPQALRQQQAMFEHTGGIHAAALFDDSGKLALHSEDVGRHNAVDKLIGQALLKKMLPLQKYLILVSGRASFELVQKSLMAGIPILAAVGAPSSLAVNLARQYNMTLLGFVRNQSFNIYSAESRII